MRKLTVGILAHVDAGKTTLSEGLLYRSGVLKKLGRVDHKNAFLDTDALEQERGITIFSKQAVLSLGDWEITLLDTPGHVDFSSEMERTLQVLDYAVLVINGTDGVQGHTQTLWQLLARYQVPTFLFINKMDLAGTNRDELLAQLKQRLHGGCVDFEEEQNPETLWENVALCDESLLNHYLNQGALTDQELAGAIKNRMIFPCFFGSALKLEGVDALLRGLKRYAQLPEYPQEFGARIFKIARNLQGSRLTYLKITGGSLKVKDLLTNHREELPPEQVWEEKVDQIRIYSGRKYTTVEEAPAGTVCAVTGLSRSDPGETLGWELPSTPPMLEPVLTYQLILPPGQDAHTALLKLEQLEEEEPQLHVVWNEQLQEIHLQLMGAVQMEILERLIRERFGMAVTFGPGNIVYRETIANTVEGIGHFEPLRHYAEVHLLLEPGERGSGLRLDTVCSEDSLDRNWQRLILTHLEEKAHLGVLTGSVLTDVKITLTAGRAHEKHTEGGDFRQATYRAVRQGLMQAESILLEPWYQFRLEVPADQVGRSMSDLQRMGGEIAPSETVGDEAVLMGSAPVANLRDYAQDVAAYTHGRGRLFCTLKGYEPCHNAAEVTAALGYESQRDLENPADSVFCYHGAGTVVKWDEVADHAHLESTLPTEEPPFEEVPVVGPPRRPTPFGSTLSLEQDKELQAIFERTYGPAKRWDPFAPIGKSNPSSGGWNQPIPSEDTGPEYLLVDGYNILFAWEELREVAREDLDTGRKLLMNILSNYQGYRQQELILVFDAYKVPRNVGEVTRFHNIYVVYTREAETADAYIEKVTYAIGRKHRVRVATSDNLEQTIILGHGALRLPAEAFRIEVEQVTGEIAALMAQNNRKRASGVVKAALDKAQKDKKK